MGGRHYIPKADGSFDGWQRNFYDYAVAHAQALGLTTKEMDALHDEQKQWEIAYAAAVAARDAWQSAVAKKDARRAAYTAMIRRLAAQLRADPTITDAQRAALGLTAPDGNAIPTGAPETAPRFTIDTSQRLRHTLHFSDQATPTRRAKPRGVFAAEVYAALTAPGVAAPTDMHAYQFKGLFTRTPAVVAYGGAARDGANAPAGQTAHYVVRWINTRGEAGPMSATGSATVGG